MTFCAELHYFVPIPKKTAWYNGQITLRSPFWISAFKEKKPQNTSILHTSTENQNFPGKESSQTVDSQRQILDDKDI